MFAKNNNLRFIGQTCTVILSDKLKFKLTFSIFLVFYSLLWYNKENFLGGVSLGFLC